MTCSPRIRALIVTGLETPDAQLEYRFSSNGGPWSAWGSNTPPQGPISVEVRQLDAANNASPASAPFNYTYDTVDQASSVTVNQTTVTDATVASGAKDQFVVYVTYNEQMLYDTPRISFSPDVAGDETSPTPSTLTYDPDDSTWVKNDATGAVYRAAFTVADNNVYDPHVNVMVTGVRDYAGNHEAVDTFTDVFTANTQTVPPTVTSAVPHVKVITDVNANDPTQLVYVRVDYDQIMSLATAPTITFSPDVSNTLTFDPSRSYWTSDTSYVAKYIVTDANVVIPNVSIAVAGAKDRYIDPVLGIELVSHEHEQARFQGTPTFSIDTLDPSPVLANVALVETNISQVTEAAATGSQPGLWIKLTYDRPMSNAVRPTITFSPDLSSTLTVDSWYCLDDRTFVIKYDVADRDVPFANVVATISGAWDTNGNNQAPCTTPVGTQVSQVCATPIFTIDTLDAAPPLANPISVTMVGTSPNAQPYMVTDADVGYRELVYVTYDQPMDIRYAPWVGMDWTGADPSTNPPTPLTLTRNLDGSYWVSNTVYLAKFEVADSNWFGDQIGLRVVGAVDTTGRDSLSYYNPNLFSVNTLTTPPNVTVATPNTRSITSDMDGSQFIVTIDYNTTMRQGSTTVVSFEVLPGEDLAPVNATLTLNSSLGGWNYATPDRSGDLVALLRCRWENADPRQPTRADIRADVRGYCSTLTCAVPGEIEKICRHWNHRTGGTNAARRGAWKP